MLLPDEMENLLRVFQDNADELRIIIKPYNDDPLDNLEDRDYVPRFSIGWKARVRGLYYGAWICAPDLLHLDWLIGVILSQVVRSVGTIVGSLEPNPTREVLRHSS